MKFDNYHIAANIFKNQTYCLRNNTGNRLYIEQNNFNFGQPQIFTHKVGFFEGLFSGMTRGMGFCGNSIFSGMPFMSGMGMSPMMMPPMLPMTMSLPSLDIGASTSVSSKTNNNDSKIQNDKTQENKAKTDNEVELTDEMKKKLDSQGITHDKKTGKFTKSEGGKVIEYKWDAKTSQYVPDSDNTQKA